MKRAITALAALAAAAASAQTAAPPAAAVAPAAAPAADHAMTMAQIIQFGGWLMYPIFALSIVGLALIIYFIFMLREEQVLPRRFIGELRDLLAAGRFVEASSMCRAHGSSIAAILGVALDYRLRTSKPDHTVLTEITEGEGSRQATLIQNQVQYLVDIGGIAPMMGLLGTVLGMMRAFSGLAYDVAKAKPVILAAGVSQALITTVAGLAVAIPVMIAYAYFRGRTAKLVASLESNAADLSSLLVLER